MLLFSGNRQERLVFTIIFPAVLNALSDGTDIAGMHKYFHAKMAKRGNWVE